MNIIEKRRKELGLTRAQLAALLGVQRGIVRKWEEGLAGVGEKSAGKVSDALSIPLNELRLSVRGPRVKKLSWLGRKRIELNLTQAQLADRTGMDHSLISYYETGKRTLPRRHVILYAKALEVTVEALLANAKVQPELTTSKSRRSTVPPSHIQRAVPDTCLDECRCIRWYCLLCKQYWTGQPIHECGEKDSPS